MASVDPRALEALVRTLDTRHGRDTVGLYKVERHASLVRALDAGHEPVGLVLCPRLHGPGLVEMLARRARARGVPCSTVSPELSRDLARGTRASGVVAVFRQRWSPPSPTGQWLVLEQLQSPGNLGCILRSAEATGAAGVLLVGSALDPFDPAVLGGAMGAEATLALARVAVADLGTLGFPLVAAAPRDALPCDQFRFPAQVGLVLGDERRGISEALARACQARVRIPMAGRADSLNVATSAGVLLYEMARQARMNVSATG